MATFLWVGSTGSTTDVYGGTGATGTTGGESGGGAWVTIDNYWNRAANWRMRVPGGQTGNTGGGATGSPGAWYYQTATRSPYGSDTVILEGLACNPADGIEEYHGWPVAELLYGGVSGATWAGGTFAGEVEIEIKQSYYDANANALSNTPYNRFRFGANYTDNPIGHGWKGLNLFASSIISNSSQDESSNAEETRFTLQGQGTQITSLFVNGVGIYDVRTSSCTNVVLEGKAYETDEDKWINKSLNYTHYGDISSLCKVVTETIDNFTYIPTYGSTASVSNFIVAPKKMPNRKGVVDIRGAVGNLEVYPYYHYDNYDGGAKYSISSYSTSNIYGSIEFHGYNPHFSMSYNPGFGNLELSFNNATNTDTINELLVNYGHFETDDLNSTLNILDGQLQTHGIIDFRDMKPGGVVEVAGYSGGVAGEGIFNASVNSTLLLPDGVNLSFKAPSGGSTGAMVAGTGVAFPGGKR